MSGTICCFESFFFCRQNSSSQQYAMYDEIKNYLNGIKYIQLSPTSCNIIKNNRDCTFSRYIIAVNLHTYWQAKLFLVSEHVANRMCNAKFSHQIRN